MSNNNKVICPSCVHEFAAIPVNIQAELSRLTAELAAYKKDAEWQPIETAPLTSKAILIYCAERQNTYIVNWRNFGELGNVSYWSIFGASSALSLGETPTHWKPLPAPPDAAIAAQPTEKL